MEAEIQPSRYSVLQVRCPSLVLKTRTSTPLLGVQKKIEQSAFTHLIAYIKTESDENKILTNKGTLSALIYTFPWHTQS